MKFNVKKNLFIKMIYSLNYDIGVHTGFSGKITDTLSDSVSLGMYSTQFFLGNPMSRKRAHIDREDIEKSKKILSKFPLNVYTHFPYISNLVGSVDVLAWNGDEQIDLKLNEVLKNLKFELDIVSNFRSGKNGGVVIHPGSFKGCRNVGLKKIAESINKIDFNNDSKLILENSAGQGTTLATTLKELKIILDNIKTEKKRNIGICIDTCHLFSVGDYDISKISEVDRFFYDFDSVLGIENFSLLHLNDSKNKLKSKKDRHESLGCGYIWGNNNMDPLKYLLKKCKDLEIPSILETTTSDLLTVSKM